jgi:hypothetical protein
MVLSGFKNVPLPRKRFGHMKTPLQGWVKGYDYLFGEYLPDKLPLVACFKPAVLSARLKIPVQFWTSVTEHPTDPFRGDKSVCTSALKPVCYFEQKISLT